MLPEWPLLVQGYLRTALANGSPCPSVVTLVVRPPNMRPRAPGSLRLPCLLLKPTSARVMLEEAVNRFKLVLSLPNANVAFQKSQVYNVQTMQDSHYKCAKQYCDTRNWSVCRLPILSSMCYFAPINLGMEEGNCS